MHLQNLTTTYKHLESASDERQKVRQAGEPFFTCRIMNEAQGDPGAGQYRRVQLLRTPKTTETATPEQKYWRKFKSVTLTKGYAPVHSIEFCPSAPHDFAVTNSTRVQIYGSKNKQVKRTISRFKDIVYSASFRGDGKLLVASGEESDVKVLDVNSRDLLRLLKGHKGAVHSTKFCEDRVHVVSGGDDKTVRYWDVSTGSTLSTLEGHEDHVRCLAQSPATPEIWASGSFDHTVKLWDFRSGQNVLSVEHGQPVQAMVMLPGGGVLVTAGGNYMRIWDILAGGRLLQTVCNHQKPITCLAVDGEGGRLLSGSLDHLRKFLLCFVSGHEQVYWRYDLNFVCMLCMCLMTE